MAVKRQDLMSVCADVKLRNAYVSQKDNARRRGLGFELTFAEWLKIWRQSGKLPKRGRGKGCYVMARPGDRGPYAVGNVKIISFEKNLLEQDHTWVETPTRVKQAKRHSNLLRGRKLTEEHKLAVSVGVTDWWNKRRDHRYG